LKVSNPLTIIAIFAGVAEAFATGALVLLPPEIQSSFVYFVMAFPSFIVITFFFVLVLKPQVLYAPSDYSDEQNFITANGIDNIVNSKVEKVLDDVSKSEPKLSASSLDVLRKSLTNSVVSVTEENFESMVLNYLQETPKNAYTTSGIGHVLSISFRTVADILIRLEAKGLVEKGIEPDTGIVLWQIKHNG